MARRSRKEEQGAYAAFVGAIALIVAFYTANKEIIDLILIIAGSVIALAAMITLTVILVKHRKRVKAYQTTPYYLETKLSYQKMRSTKGRPFEVQVYNSVHAVMGNQARILTNLSIPQANAINIDSQIDLVVLHPSGLYVVEIKDYSGPLMGRVDEPIWIPYIVSKKPNKNSKKREDGFAINYALLNSFKRAGHSNPIKQNEIHIQTLQAIIKEDYKNVVIFSDRMFSEVPTGPHRSIPAIFSLIQFTDMLVTAPAKYSLQEIERIEQTLKSLNKSSRSSEQLHKARVSK